MTTKQTTPRKPRAPKGLETKAATDKPATTEVAVQKEGALPAYLQGQAAAVLPGIDANDLIIPRIKLLQAISPEVEAFEAAKNGLFWHNVLGEVIGEGTSFSFVIASFRKKYLLMAPLGDQRGVLARAEDGMNWSPPNETFEVKLKGVKEPQKWTTKPTVRESGLAEFGSSIAGDNDSKPAAVLIYEYLIYLPDFPHLSPIVMSLARSQAKKGKDLNSKITFRGAPLHAMRFKAQVVEEVGDEGPYKNYLFVNDGWATEDEFKRVGEIAERFGNYKAADEEGVAAEADAKPTEY
jgi:hypothetical protein